MDTGASLKIEYWVYPSDCDFKGAAEFRKEVADNYISSVSSRPGEAGGNFQLAVEFVSRITLVDVVKFLLSGVAYDVIKSGAEAFVLRPFLSAYKNLRDQNQDHGIDIEQLRIIFQDTILTIDQVSKDSIFTNIEPILKAVATHSDNLTLRSVGRPYELY